MKTLKHYLNLIVFLSMLITNVFGALPAITPAQAQSAASADAVVLVNSTSVNYEDFAHFIQPYLDHFGVPYTVVDIATAPLGSLGSYALIITGHRGLDASLTALDAIEQAAIVAAVAGGTGLVNFDNQLSADQSTGLYDYVDTLFGFSYSSDTTGAGVTFAAAEHYITEKHAAAEEISTDGMTLAGITVPAGMTALATSGTQPLLAAGRYNVSGGRVVQWGSYDWMSHAVLGPLMGLDDLVWRSLVWAARKPFVMQGMPPFVTMRMDDTIGPLDWVHISNEVGMKPWLGVFTDEISTAEAIEMRDLVAAENATVSIHAFATGTSHFFYYDHNNSQNYSDTEIAANFAAGSAWHTANDIPISKFVVPHYYEVGSNALDGLANWGIEFVGTMMDPGQRESGSPWMTAGPFRKHEAGGSYDRNHNVYYADTFPTDSRFFNCITEFRDADPTTNYEWDPKSSDVPGSITYGTRWLTAGLDSMVLANLFSHEYMLYDVSNADMRTIMQGIAANLAPYNPIYVTVDEGCQYARAVSNTAISYSEYDEETNSVTVHFSGSNDMPTKFYVFNEQGTAIQQNLVDVPQLSGSGQVTFALPGELDHITVTPDPTSVIAGATRQFTAMGYDAEGNEIPNLSYTWSASAAAGTISASGLFTAGVTPGTYANAVTATYGGISSSASVEVTAPVLDHFSFDTIPTPQFNGASFPVTIRARDAANNLVVTYTGSALLSDTTGTISPSATGAFTAGVWTGRVTLTQTAASVSITAADGAVSGSSAAFAVNDLRACPCSIWEGGGTPANPNVNDNRPVEVGVKFRTDIDGYILGVKFYKGSSDTGTHTGHLWSAARVQLAEAEFVNETASGWQQVVFSTPVPVTANTTYVASYYSPSGYFADTPDYLHDGVDNAPLHALAQGVDGENGVFRYDSSGFPTLSWTGHAPNYWVDVIFDTVNEHSIFNGTGTPQSPAAIDVGHSIEVGTKFRSSVDGEIRALRYYKGAGVTGTHVGHLWSAAGELLGTAEFTNETAEGWQEATLTPAVPISADTTYIVSYFSPDGYFAYTPGGFSSAVTRTPLTALANGADGPNGVYNYDASGFPATTGNGANYWADVVFALAAIPDLTAPTITHVSPSANASGVNVYANVTAAFSESLDASTVIGANMELRDPSNNLVSAAVSYNASSRVATLDPAAALAYSTTYAVTLQGGSGGIADVAGNLLAGDFTWSFTTAAEPPPPPDEGPGGPILVIGSAGNPFGRYYAEILRAEGFNAFTATDITHVDAALLSGYDVVILGEMGLSSAQVTLFTDWVAAGGNLVAMRPDKQLASLLGLTDATGTLTNAYLLMDTTSGPGVGLVNQTIQFHGGADRYTANSGTAVLATLYSDAATATANPAVTLVSVGTAGGQAAAFTYDLARSVVYTRQGNPDWATQERDTVYDPQNLIRSSDKFFGNAASDPQPDWIDFSKIQIPQADEQQRLLANLIQRMNADKKPLPHFWYFPRGEKAVIVMTGDDHGASGTDDQWEHFKSVSPAGCSVDDWECVRGTTYLYTNNAMTDAQAAAYTAEGFEVAYHFDTGCGNFTRAGLETLIPAQLSAFYTRFPSVPPQVSQRTHCIAFSDWDSQPIVSSANGVRMDANYYYWPPAWAQNRAGLFTGSGMIMRFAQLDGTLIDSYQAVTQMTDESGMSYPSTAVTLMDNALGSLGYYGAFTTNMHTDHANHASGFAVVDAALARSVPVVSAKQMLTWLDGRYGSAFTDLAWNGSHLTFGISVGAGANGLQAMLPLVSGAADLMTITRGGSPVTYTTETVKGVNYAIFPAAAGSYDVAYGIDEAGPVVSAVTVTPDAESGVTVAWTTDEPSTSRVDYGTDPANLDLNVSAGALATGHSLYLAGLAPSTTYSYRVTSVDDGGNATTYPPVGEAALQFTTPAAVLTDSSLANFAAGTPGACALVDTDGGEVILAPAAGNEFSGALAAPWVSTAWGTGGGTTTIADGRATVNGALLATNDSTLYPIGSTVEFVANIGAAEHQYAGLALDLNGSPWAIFGSTDGVTLKARTWGATQQETDLGSAYLNTTHRYRIDWLPTGTYFYIDSNLVATHTVTFAAGVLMRPFASDYTVDGVSVVVDWMRVSPYTSPCTYTSRVLDAGELVTWDSLSWNSVLPAGASIEFSYRVGDTPDLSAVTWTPVSGGSPAILAQTGRFIQYLATLASTDATLTPILQDVTFASHSSSDTQAPTITGRSPAPGAEAVGVGGSVQVNFSEVVDADTITNASFRLRAVGASLDVPAAITVNAAVATLDPEAALQYATQYQVTVAGTVTDLAGNALGSDSVWTFTTEDAPPPILTDSSVADFNASPANTCAVDATIGDGAVRLPLHLDEAFGGSGLPSGWTSHNWSSTTGPAVGGGLLSVNGNMAFTTATYTPGRVLEFRATFTARPFESVGFAGNDTPLNQMPWVQFGTGQSGSQLYARVLPVGGAYNTGDDLIPLGDSYLGSPHTYRIEWTGSGATFFIDGAQVASTSTVVSNPLHVVASDYNLDADVVTVDWMRMYPYSSPCAFTSRVLDAGEAVNWDTIAWTAALPTGTALNLSYRSGSSANLDGAEWISLSGATPQPLAGHARYIQYRALLSTTDAVQTPVLEDVTLTYTTGADVTAPVITNLAGAATGSTTAEITWNTNEPASSQVMYGTSAGSLTAQASSAALVTGHTISLSGLASETTYYYRVVSVDEAGNSITSPPVGDAPANLTTPVQTISITDGTNADFSAGTPGTCVVDSAINNGAVRLPATMEESFAGTALPANWAGATWSAPGSWLVSDSSVSTNAATVRYDTQFGPGVSLEGVITFRAESYQHFGFGYDLPIFNQGPIIMFSTRQSTNTLYATVLTGSYADFPIPNSSGWIGSAHRYRIDWKPDGIDFYVDGNLVHTRTDVLAGPMRAGISDFNDTATSITADWMRLTPYVSPCTFASRVLDSGVSADWRTLAWTGSAAAGTAVSIETRSGDTSAPDGTWSDWAAVTEGAVASPNSRYLQYRAVLAGGANTPVMDEVVISYSQKLNQAPTAASQAVITDEDTPVTITLVGSDPDLDYLTYVVVTQPQHGSLSGTAPVLLYTPAGNYHGDDSFTFTVNDGSLTSEAGTVTITINPVNDAPVAVADQYSTTVNTPLSVVVAQGVLTNDSDQEGSPLTASQDTTPQHGSLVLNANGSFTYTPQTGWTGIDTFTYHASDGSASSTVVTVTIAVNGEVPPVPSSYYGLIQIYDNPPAAGDDILAYKPGDTAAVAFADLTGNGTNLSYTLVVPGGSSGSASEGDTVTFVINGRVVGAGIWHSGGNVRLDLHPPQALPGGPYEGKTGQPVSFIGDANDAGSDAATYDWDWDNDGVYDASGASPTHAWPEVGTYTGGLRVTDAQGGVGVATFMVVIEPATVTHTIALAAGWNLVSFNVHPADTAIASVLSSIDGSYDLVYGWDASGAHSSSGHWLKYDTIAGSPDSLAALDETMGFWIHMLNADTLEVTGLPPVTTTIDLSTQAGGWNLVAYPSAANGPMPASLTGHGVSAYSIVYAYNAADAADPWKLYDPNGAGFANDLNPLVPGLGYWLHAGADQNWSVSY